MSGPAPGAGVAFGGLILLSYAQGALIAFAPHPARFRRSVEKSIENPCELCDSPGGDPLWQNGFCRIVLVDDPDYPGFCRVILGRHVEEMTDLAPQERARLMDVVFATESALRELTRPDKINLASLGNATPHLHWHVIPRYRGDRHFPRPVWAEALRPGARQRAFTGRDALALALEQRLSEMA